MTADAIDLCQDSAARPRQAVLGAVLQSPHFTPGDACHQQRGPRLPVEFDLVNLSMPPTAIRNDKGICNFHLGKPSEGPWMAPTQIVTSREAEKPIIRIKTDRKWPERIVFDTSAPTIVPQKRPAVADALVTNPPREAFALLNAPVPEVSVTPLPVKTKRKVAKRAPHTRWVAYRPAARAEALPAGW
jgi:hypothetical protein